MIVESVSHASPAIESCTKELDVLPICFYPIIISSDTQAATMKYSEEDIEAIGCYEACRKAQKLNRRQFVAFYNRTPNETFELWEMCAHTIETKTHPKHLFWCLMFMKLYLPMDVLSIMLETSIPTLNKWIWIWIESIANRHVDVIHWTRRYRNAPRECVVSDHCGWD